MVRKVVQQCRTHNLGYSLKVVVLKTTADIEKVERVTVLAAHVKCLA